MTPSRDNKTFYAFNHLYLNSNKERIKVGTALVRGQAPVKTPCMES